MATALVFFLGVHCRAAETSVDCTGKSDCGVRGIERSVLLKSLELAMQDLSWPSKHIGLPADVIAAACGVDDDSRRFSLPGMAQAIISFPGSFWWPEFYSYRVQRVMVSRLEKQIASAKELMKDPEGSPALIAADVPGIGPTIYDARLIRTLMTTSLFPYRIRLEWKKAYATRVPYVQLETGVANFTRDCLNEVIQQSKSTCEDAVKRYPNLPEFAYTPNQLFPIRTDQASSLRNRNSFLPSGDNQEVHPKKTVAGAIAEIIGAGDASAPITLKTKDCLTYEEIVNLDPDRAPKLPPMAGSGCGFQSVLTVPEGAGIAYRQIDLTVRILKPAGAQIICSPDDRRGMQVTTAPEVAIYAPCSDVGTPTWQITGPLLYSRLSQKRIQALDLFVWLPKSGAQSTIATTATHNPFQIRFELATKPNPLLSIAWERIRALVGIPNPPAPFWCVPGPCPVGYAR